MKKIIVIIFLSLISIYGCSSSEDKAQEYYQRAQSLLDEEQPSKAALELKNAIKLHPQHADSYYLLAVIHEKNKNWKAMHSNLLNAIKFNPKHTEAIVTLAKLFLLSGEMEQAKEKLNEAFTLEPENINAQILQAVIDNKEQKKQKAFSTIMQVLEQNPQNITALQVYVAMALPEKKYREIHLAIEQVTPNEKNEKILNLLKIQLYAVQGKKLEVVKIFNSMIFKEPENLTYRQALALYFLRTNDKENAIQVLRETVQDNPENTSAKLTLIKFLAQQDINEATSELKKQIEISTTDSNTLKLALAELYESQGKKDNALDIYETILKSTEKNSEKILVKNNLTRLALSNKNVKEANLLINQVLQQEPNNTNALYNRALIKLADKEYSSAITDIRVILRNTPSDEKTLELLAAAHALNNNQELATDTIIKILEINPLNIKAANQYAFINLKEKKYSKVIEILQPLEKSQKLDNRGAAILMKAYLANKNWENANKLAENTENTNSESYQKFIKALTLQGQGNYEESNSSLLSMLESDSSGSLALTALVSNYIKQNDSNAAINFLEDFIKRNPSKNDQAYIMLTKLYLANKESEKAIRTYKKLITIKPQSLMNYQTLANIYIREGQTQNAILAYKAALTQNPEALAFRIYLASTYEISNQNKKAIEQYQLVLEKEPENEIAANNLASILSNSGDKQDLDKAFEIAKRFEETTNPYYADTLGWIYYKTGNIDKALKLIKIATEKDQLAVSHYHLGKVYIELNNTEKAKEQFSLAIKIADEKGGFNEYDDAKLALNQLKSSVQ